MKVACAALALASVTLGAAAQTIPPSADTLALARKVAAHDDFLAMIRAAGVDQSSKVVDSLGPLTPAEKAKAQAIAAAKLTAGMDRVADLLASVYAQRFTPQALRDMDAFLETPSGAAYAGRLMTVLPALQGLQNFDLRKDTLAEICAEMGKGCPETSSPTSK
jgi:hypothetical protein